MKTCRNCRWEYKLDTDNTDPCGPCLLGKDLYQQWECRPWVPVLIFALVGLALVLAMCIVIAALDQARINAIPRPEPVVYEFEFMQKDWYTIKSAIMKAIIVGYDKDGHPKYKFKKVGEYVHKTDWRRGETVVWTIYSVVGPDDGCAISKGE